MAAPAAPGSMMGGSGVGMWGAGTGWSQPAAPAPPAASMGGFGGFTPAAPPGMSGANLWGTNSPPAAAAGQAVRVFGLNFLTLAVRGV